MVEIRSQPYEGLHWYRHTPSHAPGADVVEVGRQVVVVVPVPVVVVVAGFGVVVGVKHGAV